MANAANEHDNKNDNNDPGERDRANNDPGKSDPGEKARTERANSRNGNTGSAHGAGPAFAASEPRVHDLSPELMTTLPREAGEMVRCRRIVSDYYRCNWWAPQNASQHDMTGSSGLMSTRYRVIKSRMLRATVTSDGLVIDAERQQ